MGAAEGRCSQYLYLCSLFSDIRAMPPDPGSGMIAASVNILLIPGFYPALFCRRAVGPLPASFDSTAAKIVAER